MDHDERLIGGLEPAEIVIAEYDPAWPERYQAHAREIRDLLGSTLLAIEHVGSTAVPGLAAKPIIDIQVSVACLHPIDAYSHRLAGLGYVHVPHEDDARCPFFHRPHEWPHTHHVHVVESGGDEEGRGLAFRDYLRGHPQAAREYEVLKRQLASLHGGLDAASREAYANAKTAFINRILTLARQSVPSP